MYDYTRHLLLQEINPVSHEQGVLDCEDLHTVSSPLLRATTCIDMATTQSIESLLAVSEIPFDLSLCVSREEFAIAPSQSVRAAFIELFCTDALAISHDELRNRFNQVLLRRQEQLCVVSHTFFIKTMLVYDMLGDSLFTEPEQIRRYIKPHEKIMSWGERFAVAATPRR